MKPDLVVHDSSGNVFADMGMPAADERLARAELGRDIRIQLRALCLSPLQSAALLDLGIRDTDDLMRGKLARFSIEWLTEFRSALEGKLRARDRATG